MKMKTATAAPELEDTNQNAVGEAPPAKKKASGIDLASLRLSQDFGATTGAKKMLTVIPVRKPHGQDFVRVHPDPDMRLETAILEVKEDRESFLVDRPLWPDLSGEIVPKVLITTINRQGVVSLWPIRLPGADGKLDDWNASAHQAAEMAATSWVRISANMSLGAYEIFKATGSIPEPEWPDLGFNELLDIAFKDRFIRSMDHPALKKLRGEV